MSEVKKFTTDCEIYHECTAVYNKMKKLKAELTSLQESHDLLMEMNHNRMEENAALKELVREADGFVRSSDPVLDSMKERRLDWLHKAKVFRDLP